MAVHQLVDAIDFGAQILRIKVVSDIRPSFEGGIKHTNDFRGLIVDDRATLAVPQGRYRHLAGVNGIGSRVNLVQAKDAVSAGLEIIDALRI
jgi:hypothetical protein